MHLPSGVTNSLVYCRRLGGGLGLPRLENLVKIGSVKAMNSLVGSGDVVVQDVLGEDRRRPVREDAEAMELEWLITDKGVEKWKWNKKNRRVGDGRSSPLKAREWSTLEEVRLETAG